MKNLLLIPAILIFSTQLFAQKKISVDSVSSHVGEKVVVCSEVFGIKSTEKITFINVGAAYPNSPLTVVIFAKDLPNFSDSPEKLFGNKQVCITGILKEFKGKTEMVVTKPEEIVVE
jgi:aspartyl/asparaginyl-tRNA synthetase